MNTKERKPTLFFHSTKGKPVDLKITVHYGHVGYTVGWHVPPSVPRESQANPLSVHLADDGAELWRQSKLFTTDVSVMTPALKTSVTYELSGVVDADSRVDICPDPADDAKAAGDTVEYAPTFVFTQEL